MVRYALLFLLCVAITPPAASAVTKKKPRHDPLRIADAVHGWREAARGYIPFDHNGLFDLINGGAPEYIDAGMVRGSFQRLVGSRTMSMEVYTYDFGSPEKSRAMLHTRRATIDSAIALDGFDTSRTAARAVIGAVVTYGCFGNYYVEATVQGAPTHNAAMDEVRKIFAFFEKTTGNAPPR